MTAFKNWVSHPENRKKVSVIIPTYKDDERLNKSCFPDEIFPKIITI